MNNDVLACQSISLIPQIMHEIMVKSLPPKCHLTAIYDVRPINNIMWHMSTLTICLHRQSCHSGTVLGPYFFSTRDFLTDLPYPRSSPYCMLTPYTLPVRSKSPDICCTVSLRWGGQKVQTPIQIRGSAPEGKQGSRCEYYLLMWESIPSNFL